MGKKLTDSEIVKALKYHSNHFCTDADYQNMIKLALDLINRQNAKIEYQNAEIALLREERGKANNEVNRLQEENDHYSHNVKEMTDSIRNYQKALEQVKAENERLKNAFENSQKTSKYWKSKCEELVEELETAKAEAYKECIERVKSEIDNKDGHIEEDYALRGSWDKKYFYDSEIEDVLDNLLKELVGEDNAEEKE